MEILAELPTVTVAVPLSEFDAILRRFGLIAATPPALLSDPQLSHALHRAAGELAGTQARWLALLAEAEDREVTTRSHGLSTAGWLSHEGHLAPRAARAEVTFAVALSHEPTISTALADGRLSAAQARAIIEGLTRLPEELSREEHESIAQHLVTLAAKFGPSALTRLVHHAVEVVAPEVADAADQRAIEAAEARARRDRHLSWHRDPEGGWRFHGLLPQASGEKVFTLLHAIADSSRATEPELSPGQAAADALVVLADHAASCQVAPRHGADRPRVMVTVELEVLRGAIGTATLLGSDQQISAQQARVLACDADILPAVLGGASTLLDVGRSQRLFTSGLRQALIARDRGCAFPDCERTASECEGHHIRPWHQSGRTSLDNAALLCSHHHHLIEPSNAPPGEQWQLRLDPRGRPEVAAPELSPGIRQWRQHHRYLSRAHADLRSSSP